MPPAPLARIGDERASSGGASVAVTGPGGSVAAGAARDIHVINHYGRVVPSAPASWPVQVGVIPRAADCFQERDLISPLDLASVGPADAASCLVLTGMGGVGKTQLAASHARSALRDQRIDLLVWVTASSRQAVVDAYAEAAWKVVRAEKDDPAHAAREFLTWLEPKPASSVSRVRWLVVLDNVTDPADLIGLWPPDSAHGRTVVTTRSRDAALTGASRHTVAVGLFTPEEATRYLTSSLAARGREEPAEEIACLAADLGLLPLALSQTAAYLIDAGVNCAEYRTRLADRARRLEEMRPATLPDDQTVSVAAAWSLSIERADVQRPFGLARPLLHLASMLDANGIPQRVLTSGPVLDHLSWAGTDKARRTTPEEAVGALRVLHRLSLVDHDPEAAHRAVRVHHVVQRAVRDMIGEPEQGSLARTAADALTASWPDIERDTGLAQALRANAIALVRTADDALHHGGVHTLMYRFGASLGAAGQAEAAADHFQRLAASARHHLGADHPDTLAARHDLAYWRGAAGDVALAVSAFEELLADRLRVLGPDHPHTLTTRGNLAYWQGGAGDVADAITALETLLADRTRVLGADHPDTLTTRHNIAGLQERAGDAAGAASELVELLADRLRVLGPEHPDTLATRHDLACCRGEAGTAAEAITELEELLADRVRVLGPDHPATFATRHHLARYRGKSGAAARAVADFEELLRDMVRVLGPDHPQTLDAQFNLAYWREDADVVTLRVRREARSS